jgi:hypothetical protein
MELPRATVGSDLRCVSDPAIVVESNPIARAKHVLLQLLGLSDVDKERTGRDVLQVRHGAERFVIGSQMKAASATRLEYFLSQRNQTLRDLLAIDGDLHDLRCSLYGAIAANKAHADHFVQDRSLVDEVVSGELRKI